MKTIEELEEEYKNFNIKSDFIQTKEDFILFLLIGVEDTYELEKDNNKEIKANKLAKWDAKVTALLMFNDASDEIEFLDEDNNILLEINKMVEDYRNMYIQIGSITNEDNYKELLKLVDFCTEYYNQHIDFFDSERDSLELMYTKGICMYNPKYSDNRDVVMEFAQKKINGFDKNKVLVKGGFENDIRGNGRRI